MYNKVADYPYKKIRLAFSTPFILGMSVPLVLFDVSMEIYHHTAFPLYNIPTIKRKNYIRIDRQKLSYLNINDKVWCAYCGYANGLMAYGVKIAGETERYWCSVKHKEVDGYIPHEHHKDFLEYGDEQAYIEFVNQKK